MIQAKFGIPAIACHQLERYTTAVLSATLDPPSSPQSQEWVDLMEKLARISCDAYRSVRSALHRCSLVCISVRKSNDESCLPRLP
jgi:phosphoenolpyruvate carboxylase